LHNQGFVEYLPLVEDPHLVQLAIERGFVTAEQVEHAKREQATLSERGIERSLWFLIQDFGYVTDQQSRELRRYISSSRMRALEVEGFVIQGRLGSGGMGDVFRGRRPDGEEAAVKLLATRYSQHEEYAKRFQREAKATLRLMHPYITRSISAGVIEGQRYLIMELVPGKSLKEAINSGGPLSEKDGIVLLGQMAIALRHAWRRGVLHRDVKPANIILAPPREGIAEPFCAKLCDFGLAKTWQVAGEETASLTRGELTHSGVALGTPHYMSPEQASGEHDLDQRTDIYGLGATLYHAVLGQTMYTGKSSAAIMYKQVTEALDLKPLAQGFSAGFVRLMEGMLTKERHRRYRDWDAVLDEVRALAPEAIGVVESSVPSNRTSSEVGLDPIQISNSDMLPPPPKSMLRAKRSRTPLLVGGAIAAILVIGLVVSIAALLSGGGTRATPETLANLLLAPRSGDLPVQIHLQPGDYRGPFDFGIGQSRLTLTAAGPGVRFVATGSGDGPLIRLQTGLATFVLEGITLVPGERLAIDALSGAQAELRNVHVDGGCPRLVSVSGADLRIEGFSGRSSGVGILVENQGRLHLANASIASAEVCVQVRRSQFTADRVRMASLGTHTGTLVEADGGNLILSACIIEAQGCAQALRTVRVADLRLSDVALRGARVGWRSDQSTVPVLERLTAEALDTGIEWIGIRDPAWKWDGLLARAPQPALGIPPADLAGRGADANALAAVPVLTARNP
jgi:serine/threonine protein kinase